MESYKFIGLKDGFRKVRKIFLILFLYVVIYKVIISILKDFKFNIVVDVICRHKVNSLALLLLAFTNLLTDVCHII